MWEIVIVAALSYGLWLAGDAVYRRLKPKKKTLTKKPKRHLTAEQLLGKCRYEVGHSKTNVPTYPKTEQPMDKGHIFAADNKTEPSESLPEEGSDEEFSKLKIPDVPLEFEQTGDNHSHPGEEEEEFIPADDGTVEFAQGVDAGALMEVLGIIGCTDVAVEQEQKAGELLSQMGENDITEKLRSEPKRAMRMDELVCSYYAKLPKVRIMEENPFAVPAARVRDFDIRNYVN